MSEFFLELFSEEIPANLQKDTREIILNNFKEYFERENIGFGKCSSFSTPNRLVVFFEDVNNEIVQESEEIRGPNINAPEKALKGFLRSNKIQEEKTYKKKNRKR